MPGGKTPYDIVLQRDGLHFYFSAVAGPFGGAPYGMRHREPVSFAANNRRLQVNKSFHDCEALMNVLLQPFQYGRLLRRALCPADMPGVCGIKFRNIHAFPVRFDRFGRRCADAMFGGGSP
jgi:hypothetical protein